MQGFLEDKLDDIVMSRGEDRFVLSLLPFEETTTYKKGTREGPEAIIDASGHIELLDESLRTNASLHGVATLRPHISSLASVTAHAAKAVKEHPDALLGFLGGEHSVTPAILEGLGLDDFGIVWIDAHADLRSTFCGSEQNHACAGFHSARLAPIVQVGIRSLAQEEVEFLDTSDRVKCFREWSGEVKDAIRALPKKVYVSFDVDGLNPMLMRAVGTPEPGGLLWEEALEILDFVITEKDLRAFDVVELCPDDSDVTSSFTAARLVYKFMQYYTYHHLSGGISRTAPEGA